MPRHMSLKALGFLAVGRNRLLLWAPSESECLQEDWIAGTMSTVTRKRYSKAIPETLTFSFHIVHSEFSSSERSAHKESKSNPGSLCLNRPKSL